MSSTLTTPDMIMERALTALRVGIAAGAGIAAGLMLFSLRGAPIDAFAWFVVGFIVAAGGYLGGEVVLAFAHVRHSPIVLVKAGAFLIAVSMLVLVPTIVDDFRARMFLAHADSAPGIVTGAYHRGGKHLRMSYMTGDSTRVLTDRARPSTSELQVGDTAWAFWDVKVPSRATIGRPEADWPGSLRLLLPVWLLGGVLFLAYHVNAAAAGVPRSWQRPLHLLRAYLGAAAMADIGFALMVSFQSDLADPQLQLARVFRGAMFLGAFFGLIYTAILGSIALPLLLRRRWTSAFAFAVCGAMFGAAGGLTFGPDGLAVGSISGLFAGVTFRWVLIRTGEPLLSPEAAA